MAKTLDLRTYLTLERAFVRRLQRSWRIQSAPTYEAIAKACNDHKWDEARRLVPDLDMAEVGTENREWITYMLLSLAVFGAGTVAKRKPSFVGVGSFDTFLKQVTNNLLQYLEYRATAQVQAEALQSIAEDEAKTKALPKVAWDESLHPRDKEGQFTVSAQHRALVQRFLERAQGQHRVPHEDYQPVSVTINPHKTRFVLPDGTRIKPAHAGMEHADAAFEALTYEGHTEFTALTKLMEAGVIRYNKGMGGIQLIGPITEAQAQLVTDDWNLIYNESLYVDSIQMKEGKPDYEGSRSRRIDVPFTADKLRYWINHPEVLKWEEAQHPRDKGGRFVDAEGVTHVGGFVELYHGTSAQRANKIRKVGFKIRAVAKPTMGGDPESSRNYIWLAKKPSAAQSYSEMHRHPTVLTVRLPEALYENLKRTSGPESVWSRDPIPAKYIHKWDESEHPRDKAGKFTESGATPLDRALAEVQGTDLEGGGPERAKWNALNRASMDASDVEFEARDAHTTIALELEQKYPEGTPYTDYEAADFTAYHTSREKALEAARAVERADEAIKRQEPAMRQEIVTNLSTKTALAMGSDPHSIYVVDKDPREFDVGDKHFTEAGHFNPATGQIELNSKNMSYAQPEVVKGIASHEISHQMYHALNQQREEEFQQYLKKAIEGREYSAWYHERFETKPGTHWRKLKSEYRAEFEKNYPAAMVMAGLSEGEPFSGIAQSMVDEDGHSAYAKSYWTPEARAARGHSYESAINETIAEITRYIVAPTSWYDDSTPSMDSPWTKFTIAMHDWWNTGSKLRSAGIARVRAEYAKT